MAWAAALGLASSAFGAWSANKDAKAARAQQDYQFRKQQEMQETNLDMMRGAQRTQEQENLYQRQMEGYNRNMMAQERQFELDYLEKNRKHLLEDRQMDIDRQIEEDKEAARIQQWNLENYLKRSNIAKEEREWAMKQLEESKAIVKGERDEEMKRFKEDREIKRMEREYTVGEYEKASSQAYAERDESLKNRAEIMKRISGMQSSLEKAASGLGAIPEIEQLKKSDIDNEINRRSDLYQSDVDRAADKMASIGEAGLIRGGIDRSSSGLGVRGDITRRIADEYQSARNRAYDDALNYITGRHDAYAKNVDDIIGRRQSVLREVGDVSGAGIQDMQNLKEGQSANTAMQYMPTNSAVYDRAITSADNYTRGDIGSANLSNSYEMQSRLANYSRPQSLVNQEGYNIGTAVMGPYSMSNQNPDNYLNNAQSIGNNMYNASATNFQNAQTNSYNASSGFGQDANKFINQQSAPQQFGVTGYKDNEAQYGPIGKPGIFSENGFFSQYNPWK